jgi:F-type H+-transporting ATPase subunit delta
MSVVVAKRYAKSIFELAQEKEKLETVYKEGSVLVQVFKNNTTIFEFLTNPVLSFSKKKEMFDKVLKNKLDAFTVSVLYFVIKNKRSKLLIQILEEYNLLYRVYKKIMYVDLITAKKANEELKDVIIKRLGQEKKILLNEIIDKSVLGGVLIKVDDKQFDSTVKNHINKIKSSFKV